MTGEREALASDLERRLNKACGPGWHPFALEAAQIAKEAIAALRTLSEPEPIGDVPVLEVDETGKPSDDSDPWFQLGWHKERLAQSETQRDEWKDRAMNLRVAALRTASAGAEKLRVAREALEPLSEALRTLPDDTPDMAFASIDMDHGQARALRDLLAALANLDAPTRERQPIIMRMDRKTDAWALRTLADYIESDTHLKPGNKVSWSDILEGVRRHYLDAPTGAA